jgi:hypothetical protein
MAGEREAPTTTDYVVTALSPVLVMLMVGSLVFFLVEVLYEGKYSGRLLYTLFFFVVGAVLVARIAIEVDASRASLYGVMLGAATYAALLTYVEYPGGGWLKSFGWLVNLGLMVLIWWSAHKLTWDCTHIDEKRKGAGRGILSAAGLDADVTQKPEKPAGPASTNPGEKEKDEANPEKKRKGKKKRKHESRLWDWIERYKKYREERRNAPHTPGVWVIYFALAALPLFALGQSLISPDDSARRQATFLQMVVYVASALGLLVTTSLLGLRRYLRQRKAKIPMTLAGGWLGLGAILIVVFLAIGAFMPRPHSEVPWFGIQRAGKSDREASNYAMRRDSAGKGDGAEGNQTKAGDGSASGKGGKPGGGSKGSKGSGKGQSGKGGNEGKSDQSGGDEQGDGGGNGKDSEAKKDEDGGKGDDENRNTSRSGEEPKNNAESRERSRGSQSSSELGATIEKIAGALKWFIFAIVAILVVVFVVLAILRYLAPFTNWAQRLLDAIRNWWANLWGRKAPAPRKAEAAVPLGPLRPPPFNEFSNPFADGSASGRDLAELVAYTFMAFDSWAWDRDCGRDLAETPLEFAARVIDLFPDLGEVIARFAKVYARVSYSDDEPPDDTLAVLEEMWDGMIHGVAVA